MIRCWDVLPAQKADAYARAWAEILNAARIPAEYWSRLYLSAVEYQAFCRERGSHVPDLTAELLVSRWAPLSEQLRQEQIERGRTLTTNAQSVCRHCGGSNFKQIEQNGYKGVVRCDHEDH